MKCPTCGTVMKDLFTGTFCPRDCDRPRAPAPTTSWTKGEAQFYTHDDGSIWSMEWVEPSGWPAGGDHRGWHMSHGAHMTPDERVTQLLIEKASWTLGGDAWKGGPGLSNDGLDIYSKPCIHCGYVFRRLTKS